MQYWIKLSRIRLDHASSVRILLQAAILLHGDAEAAAGAGGLIPKVCCNLK